VYHAERLGQRRQTGLGADGRRHRVVGERDERVEMTIDERPDDLVAQTLGGGIHRQYPPGRERIVAFTVGEHDVLAGGELAAMVVCDAVLRKLPGALGDSQSAVEESYSEALEGAPEYPHYTRPASYRGWEVPEILLSGDHARVRDWRREQARERVDEHARPPQTPGPHHR
jgi:hypothetical protein